MSKKPSRRTLSRRLAPLFWSGFLTTGSLTAARAMDYRAALLASNDTDAGQPADPGNLAAADTASPASPPVHGVYTPILPQATPEPVPAPGQTVLSGTAPVGSSMDPLPGMVQAAPVGDVQPSAPPEAPAPQDSALPEMNGDEVPPQKPQTQPAYYTPLPGSNPREIADGVPLPENPVVPEPFSQWDLAQVETPMFVTEAINDFAERPVYLTGNWSVKPHLSIGMFYDGNIFVQQKGASSDFIIRTSPGVTMRLGNTDSMFYMVADYTAGVNWYTVHSRQSDVDQNASASLQWSMPKTIVGLHLGVSSDTGTDIDATNRVHQNLYFAGITTHYLYSDKVSFDLNGDYTRSDFNGLISSSQMDASAFVNYQYSPKTQFGLGGAAGYVMVPGTSDQIYEQANVRTVYRATGKVTLISEVGAEFRQYEDGRGQSVTPVVSLSAAWDVKEGTQLNLSVQRQMYVSAILADQDYTATSVSTSVVQRITDNVNASLTLGFINSVYSPTKTGVTSSREDNYIDIRPGIAWRALSWLSVGIFYDYSQNFSHGQEAAPFARDRGGIDFAIVF